MMPQDKYQVGLMTGLSGIGVGFSFYAGGVPWVQRRYAYSGESAGIYPEGEGEVWGDGGQREWVRTAG